MTSNHEDLTNNDRSSHWTNRNPFRSTSQSPPPRADHRGNTETSFDDAEWDEGLQTPPQAVLDDSHSSRFFQRTSNDPSDDDASALGDYADEYSRRVSGLPLSPDAGDDDGYDVWDGEGEGVVQDDDASSETLVHSMRSGEGGGIPGENRVPSTRRAHQAQTSWIPFPSPELRYQSSGGPPPSFNSPTPRGPARAHHPEGDDDVTGSMSAAGLMRRRPRSGRGIHDDETGRSPADGEKDGEKPHNEKHTSFSSALNPMARNNSSSLYAANSETPAMDPDDPRVTGREPNHLEEHKMETDMLRRMDYRSRRKHIQRMKIEFNVVSLAIRQGFILKLARALMTFGAPSHRIESQLTSAARILEIKSEFIHLPGVIICSFGEQDTDSSETHFVKTAGRLSLGALHEVHLIYRSVVHDEISAGIAGGQLDELMNQPPIYSTLLRCVFAFWLSVLICPLAFGGSFIDMWISGLSAFVLSFLQLHVAKKSALYANVFEITTSIVISFAARGLSAIRSQIFCYTAISSSAIIGILPGYLILSSSLELASKNIVNGSVKMVYALIYTLFLGFGLQIGSDFYLLLDQPYRHQLQSLKDHLASSISLVGVWTADNGTSSDSQVPMTGTFTFSHTTTPVELDIIVGCYRPERFPWYLQPFPLWASFIIVPIFSIISSLNNLQPIKTKELPVMVIISCCSYAANKVANHYIFNRSDVVSAIGAFTVGLLGNIYSRKMGGTAFTSMVTGVLFLVPSGLSSAGGITANGNGIDIGGAMIAVTIGITVGLFMSQSLVYTFGSRKSAAVFSF